MEKTLLIIIIIWAVLISLFEISIFVKLERIEKKSAKSVVAIRFEQQVNLTIKQYEERGWLVLNVERSKEYPNMYKITFIK